MILSKGIRSKFLSFFKGKEHAVLPSASLVPENDPSVLFTTAGVQPLVPYLLGEKHPEGNRLASAQKCIRTTDIDEVGDATHNTFFEMLGNWSLGDYFKKDSISWSWEFLASKDWLGLDPDKLYVSVFKGDKDASRDVEAIMLWKESFEKAGIEAGVFGEDKNNIRIFLLGKEDNWWPAGGKSGGPQGPDTEIFYYVGKGKPDFQKERPGFNDENFVEIWNNVFVEFKRGSGGELYKLERKSIDTGMGLERIAMIIQGVRDVYKTDLFKSLVEKIEKISGKSYEDSDDIKKAIRIVADHMRSATFILGDDSQIIPSNLDRGYVLRRLIRRAIRYGKILGVEDVENLLLEVSYLVIEEYQDVYEELLRNKDFIKTELKKEVSKFVKTLEKGMREFEKRALTGKIGGEEAFVLFSTYGFPFELTQELALERNIEIKKEDFEKAFEEHQNLSKKGSSEKFKGGLKDVGKETTKLHTTTHLLLAALRKVLGDHVEQKGSNITAERLRFDFSHKEKLTDKEVEMVENLINEQIDNNFQVVCDEMDYEEARKIGATGVFHEKYGDRVKVYTIGSKESPFSCEICGGPHVDNLESLGRFRIKKQESVGAGVRRIKAVLD